MSSTNDSRTERLAAALASTTHTASSELMSVDDSPPSDLVHEASAGFCSECTDQPHSIRCEGCAGDFYCEVCFQALHHRGSRRSHVNFPALSPLLASLPPPRAVVAAAAAAAAAAASSSSASVGGAAMVGGDSDESDDDHKVAPLAMLGGAAPSGSILDRSQFMPLRLHYNERRLLRLVEAALNVSEYTDKVDIKGLGRARAARIGEQLKAVFACLCGLLVAEDYEAGKVLMTTVDAAGHGTFYSSAFEIARRYKVLNPDKMRNDYGKLLFLLQDSRLSEISDDLGVDLVRPLKTVHAFLLARGPRALALLSDPLIEVATRTIVAGGRSRAAIDSDIRKKNKAVESLAAKYSFGDSLTPRSAQRKSWFWFALSEEEDVEGDADAGGAGGLGGGGARSLSLSAEDVRHCLYSIGDNNTFLVDNVVPVEKMLTLLETHFSPNSAADASFALGISSGVNGARLTHSHARQFCYVRQSLILWHCILKDFYRFWMLAEFDFLNSGKYPYRLTDTGQGLNRVQAAPSVSAAMARVLHEARNAAGGDWVGSSVVHLGDHNVPNAFSFLDKYTQVSRLLSPIVLVIEAIPTLLRDHASLRLYVDADFGGQEGLIRAILADFFRHGFDGSGADNFFDAGSCIDGRLTSAWEWSSRIDKKKYAPVFKLCSVLGFDGRWER